MQIVFSGMDGAGKSTQIELLSRKIKSRGERVQEIWARGGYTPGMEFSKRVFRKVLGKRVPPAGESKRRTNILRRKKVSLLWLTLAMFDLFLLYAVWIRVLKLFKINVICDRYLADTKIDFINKFPDSFKALNFLWIFLEKVSPVPDYQFLCLIPVEESMKRSKLKDEPFPDDKNTLVTRLKLYNEMREFREFYKRIDCMKSKEEVHSQILLVLSEG